MGAVLAECPVHRVVKVDLFDLGNRNVTFANSATTCPIPGCGELAMILDGWYVTGGIGGAETVYTPTLAARRRLETVLAWAQTELSKPEPDVEKVAARVGVQIEKDAPKLYERIKTVLSLPALMGAATLAALLVAILTPLVSDQGISAEDLQRILEETTRNVQPSQESPEPAPPIDRMPSVLPPESEPPGQGQPS